MGTTQRSWPLDRRTILKTSAAIAAVQLTSPFIIKARGETPVRIGMVDPAHPPQGDPDNMFTVRNPVPGEKAAGPAEATGCKIQWPA
jgi:hypothetical protein